MNGKRVFFIIRYMCYLALIILYYLMLFCPSLVGSPLSYFFILPLFLIPGTRRVALIVASMLISASLVLDCTHSSFSTCYDSSSQIGVTAIEDGAIKSGGRYAFPAVLEYCYDGWLMYSSSSGEVYVYSDREEVRKGDRYRCSGYFAEPDFFIAESVSLEKEGFLRGFRKRAEALLRNRLEPLGEDERDLALMLLLAMSDNGDLEISRLGRQKGVSHVFALSGMHLSVISSFLLPLISPFLGKKRGRKAVLLPLFLFTFLSGFRASLLRALIFRSLFAFIDSDSREEIFSMTFIIHAYLFPESLMRAGAVFSYLSIAGMFLLSERLESFSSSLTGFRFSFLFNSLSCLVITIPYSYYLFSSYSLSGIIYSPPVNFLVTLYMALLFIYLIFPFFPGILTVIYTLLMKILNLPFLSEPQEDMLPYHIVLSVTLILFSLSIYIEKRVGKEIIPCKELT